ncbi:MAG: hypothetical protein HFG48_01125 [Bacilli bacterium]|nr:hypothetical protein [Bacilli bacterium]
MDNERLFESHVGLTLEKISDKINEIFDENFEEYDEKDSIKKWNSFPVIFLEEDDVKRKFLDMVIYIDELYIEASRKVSLITSLAGMIELSKIPITKFTDGNLFTLLSYLEGLKLDGIKEKLKVFENDDLLKEIRVKSLDMTERIFIMRFVDDLANASITNIDDKNEIDAFLKSTISFLANCSHDELMEKSGFDDYMDSLDVEKEKRAKKEINIEE